MNKITEMTKTVQLVKADAYGVATTYNGTADASGIGIDVSAYNEALIILNSGTAAGTNTVTLLSTNDNTAVASAATAITDAAFTVVTSANDDAVQVARVNIGADKKYLIVSSAVADDACDFGVVAVLNKAQSVPTAGNTVVFDV